MNKIKQLTKNDFNKNVLTLLSGTMVAQGIPIAISPILTRLYTPNDFGVLALIVAISAVFGSIANARYEIAIVLPEKDEDAINLTALSVLVALALSFSLFAIIVLFHNPILSMLGNENISFWLYMTPVIVFFIGLFNTLNFLNTRFKQYKFVARAKMYKAVVSAAIQVIAGLIKPNVHGLVGGQLSAHIFGNGSLLIRLMKNKELLAKIKFTEMKRLAKEYINFPKYSMWAVLANNLSQNIISIFISMLFSTITLGFYSLVNRILATPSLLIGTSIGQVFFQQATAEKNKHGHSIKTYKSTMKKLLYLAIPAYVIMFVFIEDVIIIVFGEDWSTAGQYAQIMMPLFFFRFITSPVSTIVSVYQKNGIDLAIQFSMLFITAIDFVIALFFHLNVEEFLYLLTYSLVVHRIGTFYIYYKISKGTSEQSTPTV
ncbi:lipopolysaccharide biosynthesis protein [Metabacillus bambusae]|uniref:Oligosaccharide flippase family protein n=1 Tax=Metabacillus bambusae TaxID=2795218 RepID=A0ABS3N0H8_9BACI|nr:oligosaccharide flippase family protein [Metabacillus bambusae]MBO1511771.1 oligosaccharide flippase family protein [Metabacillus bambusae]